MESAAELRLRRLAQNIYDIGDEIADDIDHIVQAMADWDEDLVEDCLVDLAEDLAVACQEVRISLSQLQSLTQAYVSGVRSGTVSADWRPNPSESAHPGRTLSFAYDGIAAARRMREYLPSQLRLFSREDQDASLPGENDLSADSEIVEKNTSGSDWRIRCLGVEYQKQMTEFAEGIVKATHAAVQGESVVLHRVFLNTEKLVQYTAEQWKTEVIHAAPHLVQKYRGKVPPPFLAERLWAQNIAAKVYQTKLSTCP